MKPYNVTFEDTNFTQYFIRFNHYFVSDDALSVINSSAMRRNGNFRLPVKTSRASDIRSRRWIKKKRKIGSREDRTKIHFPLIFSVKLLARMTRD